MFFAACTGSASNTNANLANKPKEEPSPKPTMTEADKEKQRENEKAEREKAIKDFVAKTYPGWQLKGISNEWGECEGISTDHCNILLINGQKEKVVAVMIKKFVSPDGKEYQVVFEARPIDLSKAKIEILKQRERSYVLENLTVDDCSEVIDDMRAESYIDDREPYDPR